jgi:hypothetical protein
MHLAGTLAIDFLTVPTATFRTLYVFIVLSLERRVLLHVNVTAHPHAAWTAQQMVEAMGPGPCRPLDPRPRRHLRCHLRPADQSARPQTGANAGTPSDSSGRSVESYWTT